MDNYYEQIEGWFTEEDADFYKFIVNNAPNKAHFVEVGGSWKGRSSVCMAVEIANSGKQIKFDCVDNWEIPPEVSESLTSEEIFEVFLENMKPVEDYYRYMKLSTTEAAELFNNESLDFVFIDGLHDTDSVNADIEAWLPKVKIGGIIAGHDYITSPSVRSTVRQKFPNVNSKRNCWYHIVTEEDIPTVTEEVTIIKEVTRLINDE